jgi:hypothetical protein
VEAVEARCLMAVARPLGDSSAVSLQAVGHPATVTTRAASIGLAPLTELTGTYQGEDGGL